MAIEDRNSKIIKKRGINEEWNVKTNGSNVFARSIHFVAENRIILDAFISHKSNAIGKSMSMFSKLEYTTEIIKSSRKKKKVLGSYNLLVFLVRHFNANLRRGKL